MLDIKWIRENPAVLDEALKKRGAEPQSAQLLQMDEEWRALTAKVQEAQSRRNTASREIGEAMKSGDNVRAETLKAEVSEIKMFLSQSEEREKALQAKLNATLSGIPNLPLDDVPVGADEEANQQVRIHGEKPSFAFQPKEHFDLGEGLGMMDFERAAKLSGTRFTVITGPLARLGRALGQFMLDLHTGEHGYKEVQPPLLVRDETMYGTGQLPKFGEDLFRTTDGRWLIPTAEVPLTNLVREEIIDAAELPKRFTALTPCFRSEAGSAGRDTRGMLRQHQFDKVELVSITDEDSSLEEHERMTACAEEVLRKLGLHYRVMVLSTGDMGFGARKTYDLEVWLPGQDAYREISSCSVCGDFQARRMNARYRDGETRKTRFAHTLNGSGVAVGRALIAVMENYQNKDGSITIPNVLRPYMGGKDKIAVS
jgi:seryl-tRNA synthetase